jgi:hypothetical protein
MSFVRVDRLDKFHKSMKYSLDKNLNTSRKCFGGHHQNQVHGCKGKQGDCECKCHKK